MPRRIPLLLFATAVAAGAVLACGGESWVVIHTGDFGPGIAKVSGRLDDPHNLRTPDTLLSMYRQVGNAGTGINVKVARDGSFTTPPLPRGFYSFELIRTPHSATHPATTIGVGWVEVGDTDLDGVVLSVRRDMELQGRYRIASDRANPPWPESIHLSAPMVAGGTEVRWGSQNVFAAEGGRFFLRNAFGPRVLRAGYTPADKSRPAPARVLLDGRDITDIPTDFSEHEGSDLEVVITDQPPRLVGMVNHGPGSPARGVTVVMFSADPAKRFGWASTSHVATTGSSGLFSIAAMPGAYLVQALPEEADPLAALRSIPTLGRGAVPVEIGDEGTHRVVLTSRQPRPPR